MKNLAQALSELDIMSHPHRRGRLFEPFVSQLLEEEGYKVNLDPNSAPPRQTDLYAAREGDSFLIEVKWPKKPSDVGHVSSLRERVRECSPGVYGCFFSMSGYTPEAIRETFRIRNPEILLFDENEIRGIATGALSFSDLLSRKKQEIRANAKAWFTDWNPVQDKVVHRSRPEAIQIGQKTELHMFSFTRDNDILFSTQLLDFSGSHRDSVFSLNLSLDVYTLDDLHRTILTLKKHLALAGDDSFAIHQRNAGWYGLRLDGFLSAVKDWRRRYLDLNWKDLHHSEELAYFDRLDDGGLVCLTSRQGLGENAYLHSTYVEILYPGIPVDMSSLRRLCQLTKNHGAKLEALDKNPVETQAFHPRVPVEPIGFALSEFEGTSSVSGLIVKNPFFGRGIPPGERASPDGPLRFLSNNEHLLCSLKHWHGLAGRDVQYEMHYVEACWIEHIPILHVACDWKDRKKVRPMLPSTVAVK